MGVTSGGVHVRYKIPSWLMVVLVLVAPWRGAASDYFLTDTRVASRRLHRHYINVSMLRTLDAAVTTPGFLNVPPTTAFCAPGSVVGAVLCGDPMHFIGMITKTKGPFVGSLQFGDDLETEQTNSLLREWCIACRQYVHRGLPEELSHVHGCKPRELTLTSHAEQDAALARGLHDSYWIEAFKHNEDQNGTGGQLRDSCGTVTGRLRDSIGCSLAGNTNQFDNIEICSSWAGKTKQFEKIEICSSWAGTTRQLDKMLNHKFGRQNLQIHSSLV